MATAPSTGANSFVDPPHILISPSFAGNEALELVFHEASHTLAVPWRGDPLPWALGEAADEVDMELPDGLWHVVLFHTTGEDVRRILEEAGETGYTPFLYVNERFGSGTWGRYRDAIEKTWPAYMDGERSLSEAASELLRALGGAGDIRSP